MAEAALFSVASKILSTVASPAFEKAYEKACSIWNAKDDLDKLKMTIATIQAVLLDAERKQNDSAAVKIWMKRVKEVLYDADDLFDEVATDDLLRQRIKGSKVVNKVRDSCSRLNPIVSNNSIAKKVKTIRDTLLAISKDMKAFKFVECRDEKPISGMRKSGQDTGSFVDAKSVIGRDEDKQAILEMLLHESKQVVGVIAIVGIGGMGKTTLTQLVYNDKEVEMNFEERWFACISDSSSDTEVFGKIFQSIDETCKGNYSVNFLQNKIKESIEGKKFLLVLDDVWDDDRARWQNRMSLLSSGAKGSKIIMSTRSELVARAVGAFETHNLCGLSEEDSWDLFKSVVSFTPEQEKDPTRIILGREIVKKCANVPLAIKSIASLLFEKNTIQEWESIRNEELPRLGHSYEDGIMPVLKLSYEHLSSNLKHCFAFCSLFPKDYVFHMAEIVTLWIAQGYISPSNEKQVVEDVGHSYFMDLFRRSFFQRVNGMSFFQRDNGRYTMHDLIHDLAIHVAGEESLMLTTSSHKMIRARHVSVGYTVDDSCALPESLHNVNRLRSFLFLTSGSRLAQGIQFANWKSLRALRLKGLGIKNVPSSIGELKHLRYLDISGNGFKEFPDSITKLVNLCTLNINHCHTLELLPNNFGKLVSLRHLYNEGCLMLKHISPGFEELTCLQSLDEFRVEGMMDGGQRFRLDGLSQLKLRGGLEIRFGDDTVDWDGIECWQPPLSLEELRIWHYKGMRIPNWGNGREANTSSLPKLTSLKLWNCPSVKCLPSFRHIPNIKILILSELKELEYIEEEEEALFIPDLERLELNELPKLKVWSSRKDCSTCTLASLSRLQIWVCPELKSMLLCPRVEYMSLDSVSGKQIQQMQLLPIIRDTPSSSSCLEDVSIRSCDGLACFPGESLTSLRRLTIYKCMKLKKVELPPSHLNKLEELELWGCRELELWEEKKRNGVDWDSLPKLRLLKLGINQVPSPERFPDSLRHCQELGELKIIIRITSSTTQAP